ncbi:hypothetical protein Tco_0318750 [Tanacetum coccineum]
MIGGWCCSSHRIRGDKKNGGSGGVGNTLEKWVPASTTYGQPPRKDLRWYTQRSVLRVNRSIGHPKPAYILPKLHDTEARQSLLQ